MTVRARSIPPPKGGSPLRIGVSTCLMGERVRWDGTHERDGFVTEALARFAELVPVCPEVEMGLGVPRDPIRLEGTGDSARLVAPEAGEDLTDRMDQWAARRVRVLRREGLCGYILKKDSPSCGLQHVRVWPEKGPPRRSGRGRFAAALQEAWPTLPLEEEERLRDPAPRERWLDRVFASWRLEGFFRGRWNLAGLVAFHTREKLLLVAHSPAAYEELGRMLAGAKRLTPADLKARYTAAYHAAFAKPASRRRHVAALEHALDTLRDRIDEPTHRDLHARTLDYGEGRVPRWVPLMLVGHTATRLGVDALTDQVYFDPHPAELMLRSWR